MGQFSEFAPFGLFEFDDSPSDAETIYNQIKNNLGTTYDWTVGTYEEARVFAAAMQLAYARSIVKRVPSEFHPLTSYDMLQTLEKDWACIPGPSDTVFARQLRVSARKILMAGSREEALYTDLLSAIGTGLVKIVATPPLSISTIGAIGSTLALNLAPKFYRIIDSVMYTGAPVTISIQAYNGSAAPLVGEPIVFEPENVSIVEKVVITASSYVTPLPGETRSLITGVFSNPHSSGAWALTDAPTWLSLQRHLQIVVKPATAASPASRLKINQVMARHVKTVTTWDITATSSASQVGPFVIGNGVIGSTALGATATTF